MNTPHDPTGSLANEPESTECEHISFELIPLHSGLYRACCNDCGETREVFDEP